ncbi:hypothetical protein [Caproiciproducens faecalis]|uniref:Uncharacterized protein n=1 Tax=Caproiciproducens faecalis TaxID=2820301 RepID=A0ABS7DL55_9FIRM|nr:hypothetical protein [Caproiciproducens faecalis]MBW7571958.1 hypothetical protein [Caproiciproducens faecalis]
MLYRIDPWVESAKLYTEPRSGSKLPYRTVKEMRKLYPDGNFTVIGEIGGGARPPDNGDRLLSGDGKSLTILPRGSLKKPFEWIAGYVAVNKNTYIAAVRSLIPKFSRLPTGGQPNDTKGSA